MIIPFTYSNTEIDILNFGKNNSNNAKQLMQYPRIEDDNFNIVVMKFCSEKIKLYQSVLSPKKKIVSCRKIAIPNNLIRRSLADFLFCDT